jgi:hypothetical protein
MLIIAIGFESSTIAQQPIEPDEFSQMQSLDEKALKAKAEVARRGVGEKSKVRVKMRDKHQFTGRIIQIDEYSFQLRVEPTLLDDLEPAKGTVLRIPYADVEKVRGARSRAANTFLGIGATVALVVILAAVVVLEADRCRRGNCGSHAN